MKSPPIRLDAADAAMLAVASMWAAENILIYAATISMLIGTPFGPGR